MRHVCILHNLLAGDAKHIARVDGQEFIVAHAVLLKPEDVKSAGHAMCHPLQTGLSALARASSLNQGPEQGRHDTADNHADENQQSVPLVGSVRHPFRKAHQLQRPDDLPAEQQQRERSQDYTPCNHQVRFFRALAHP